MLKTGFLLLLSVIFISSCRECEDIACTDYEGVTLKLVHYDASNASNLVIRHYYKFSNFSMLVDTMIVHPETIASDTVIFKNVDRPSFIESSTETNYDIEIYNPADSKFIRLSDIEREHNYVKRCHGAFVNNYEDIECENKLLGLNYSVNTGSIDMQGNNILVYK